ncbi:type I polyketide synthase [Paenibacillus polymyxa]|uniref:type I polyketide synthase n=1 Tax=Paenibacillus polymyxa TaxID=1406 RepID=UPI0032170308
MKQYENSIAIVGMGCRFPGGANSVDTYWENLKNGVDCVTEVPENRWSLDEFYHPNEKVPGKSHSKSGGFIDRFDEFDASFFGVNAREAEYFDPQQRQMLEIVWEAFENAGLRPGDYVKSRTGVFIGAFTLDYKILQFADTVEIGTHTAVGSMMTMLSNRISYTYDFIGPSMSIDTACSSSLVTIHEACMSLKNAECDMALAGGIELIYAPEYYVAETKGGFLSKDGRCKTFDEAANGYVRGEGGGVVILKRLEDAVRDGNKIYAVIRQSLVNQDGKTVGITVPNDESQRKLLEEVYGRAGIEPKDVQYVELHGTGTGVGDPIEANVIAKFFGGEREQADQACIMASVKANIGHLEASAGIASVIKVVCSMQEETIAPHIGMKSLNPKIKIQSLNVKIPTKLQPWPKTDRLMTAGVNSFGFGGTNAHLILQEYRDDTVYNGAVVYEERPKVLTVFAKTNDSLMKLAKDYSNFLSTTEHPLDAICYNAAIRREKHHLGLTVIGNTKEEIAGSLVCFAADKEDDAVRFRSENKDHRIVFIFTGMGPQWYAMGRELFQTDPVFHETVQLLDKEFSKHLSWSIIDEMMKAEAASNMSRTDVAQPMNFVVQVALFNMWKSMGITPDVVVGHSVGEVASLYVAGVYTLEDAVKIAYHRSRSQYKLTGKGGMLAVGLPQGEAAKYLEGFEDTVSFGAFNSNTSITLSGNLEHLEKIAAKLEENLIFNRFLKVNVPYHSVAMLEIKDQLLESLKEINPQQAKIRLYTTANGQLSDGTNLDNHYWWLNVSNPVYFAQACSAILKEGYTNFVEVGPHPVLAKSIQEIAAEMHVDVLVLPSLRRDEPEMNRLFQTYAELSSAGCHIDWSKVYKGRFDWFRLPTYPWEHKRYWKEPLSHMQKRLGIKDHKLLGYRANSAVALWEAEINDYILPFIKDHRINDQCVVAGAHYIETAFQILKQQREMKDNPIYELSGIEFKKAAFLDENNIAHLSTFYDKRLGEIEIFSSTTADKKTSVLNFKAKVRRRQISVPTDRVNVDEIKSRCRIFLSGNDCYAGFTKAGFQYGPAFQGIKSARLGENETFAEFRTLGELGSDDINSVLHPSLLDAAFQCMILNQLHSTDELGEGDLKLPVSIERLTVFRKAVDGLSAHSVLKKNTAEEIVGDIEIYTDEGQIVAKISGFTARTLENDEEHAVLTERDLADWSYKVEWKETEHDYDEQLMQPAKPCEEWIVFCDGEGIGEKVARKLIEAGMNSTVYYADYQGDKHKHSEAVVNAMDIHDYERIFADINPDVHYGVLFMWGLDVPFPRQEMTSEDINLTKNRMLNPIRHVVNTLNKQNADYKMWVVTQNAVQITAKDEININQASVVGMSRVIAQNESITNWGAVIDIDGKDAALDMLCWDLQHLSRENEIAYRQGKRYTSRLQHVLGMNGNVPVILDPQKVYILTGGLGSLGQITVNWMFERGARHFVLIGRSEVSRENPSDSDKIAFLDKLVNKGAFIETVAVDITDEVVVCEFFQQIRSRKTTSIGGIFHIAGVVRDELMISMMQKQFDEVYDPKAKGAWVLSKYTWDDDLDFFVMYSSCGAAITSVGQVNYAAGNSFMDALAFYRRKHGRPGQSLGWGAWGVGMVKEKNLIQYYKYVKGMKPIYADTGMQAMERVLGQNEAHVIICGIDWPQCLTNYPGKPPLFHHLAELEVPEDSSHEEISLLDTLALAESEEERIGEMTDFFIGIVSEITYSSREAIRPDEPLNTIGVDSIMATEIRNKINDKCGVTIAITDILGGLSLDKISRKNYGLLLPQIEARRKEIEEMLTSLKNMSEETTNILVKQ